MWKQMFRQPVPKAARFSAAILLGLLVGAFSLWLIQESDSRRFDALKANALCLLDLPAESLSLSRTFTNSRSIDMFHLALKTGAGDEALSVSISGERGLVASVSKVKAGSFGLGKQVPPGNYSVTLRQEPKGKGGTVVVADAAPVFTSGWQIWSRTYVGLLALSAICAVLLRKAEHSRTRASSLAAFHSLLLGFAGMFAYLLFHEGGHALAQIAFGHFDLARSDFWGIHGHPHSGGSMGSQLEPWQQTVISCAGPMLPTLVGFGLFLLWSLPSGRKLRSARPMLNLYSSALVAMLVVSEAICEPAYLLRLIHAEGDLLGYVAKTGGSVWLAGGFLCAMFILSAAILWRVLPEVVRAWKARFLPSGDSTPHAAEASVPPHTNAARAEP
jgi:hypothetical protein